MLNVVLASHNPGKLQEFQCLLREAPFRIIAWEGSGEIIEETGSTYLENARLKASFVAQQTGLPALADDSGIEVDFLSGAPGIRSARFVSDVPWENSREILLRLMAVPMPQRTARMRAVLALVWPDGHELTSEGILPGVILTWPRGTAGFGVDPIFSQDGRHSLAEMRPEDKNRISHRGRASQTLIKTFIEKGL